MWRAVIGLFLSRKIRKCFISGLRCYSISNLKFALFFVLLLLCHGDVESNSGSKKSGNCQPLKFCDWNLNSILSENCFKISLLKSFNALYNYDFICLSETFLSLSVSSTLDSLNIDGYNLCRSDHPSDSKRGGVCCYCKESLPIRILKITPMTECLVLEMLYNNKLVIASVIYRSPSQSPQEFAQFEMLFSQLFNDITSKKPFFSIILGDFIERTKCWWTLDKQSKEGDSLFLISSTSGYTQLINSATNIIENSSSCIDLIFTQQPNLVTSSEVHTSLHNSCHHQITFAHINLLIEYPPPYHRMIWDYSNADILNIRKSMSSINWSHLFSDNYIDIQVSILEERVLNVFKNFVPNKYVVFDDKEAIWIKQLIKERDSCFSKYQSQDRRVEDLRTVTSLADKINKQISNNRE